jgi:hypothetical protein
MSAADSYMPDPNVLDAGQSVTQQAQQLPDNTQAPQQPATAQPPAQSGMASDDLAQSFQPGQQDPDAGSSTHGWRAVLKGALQGLGAHVEGAGEGFVTGGLVGAAAGAVNPNFAQRNYDARVAMQQAHVQQAQAAAKSAMQDTQYQAENHEVQLGMAQTHLAQLDAQFASMPKDFQDHLLQEGAEAGQHLIDSGIEPVFSGNEADAKAQLQARMQVKSDAPLNVVSLPDGEGNFNVFELPGADKTYDHAVELTIGHDSNGEPIKKTYPAGGISISRALNLETAAMVDYSKVAGKIQTANQTGVTAKNQGAANKSNAAANAAPKVDNFLVGSMQDGSQVAGTQADLQAAGATGITKLPAAEASKVVVARQLTAPDGLFHAVAGDLATLNAKGGLNVATARWNDFMAGKVGAGDPAYTKLRTDTQLLSTAIMQAHVGSRGSEAMLEHFKGLADAGKMDSQTLTASLQAEFHYVREKAMLPKKAGK